MENKKHIFSEIEKRTFVEILKKYRNVVESKKTDGHSLKIKNATWNKITCEYNANPHAYHKVTSKQLRRLWMNMKQRQREKLSIKSQHQLITGVGVSTGDAVIDLNVSQMTQGLLVKVDSDLDTDTVPEMIDCHDVKKVFRLSPHPCISPNPKEAEIAESPNIPTNSSQFTSYLPPTSNHGIHDNEAIIQKEYHDRKRRADELHLLEIELMKERIREAKAKANLAELILEKTNI